MARAATSVGLGFGDIWQICCFEVASKRVEASLSPRWVILSEILLSKLGSFVWLLPDLSLSLLRLLAAQTPSTSLSRLGGSDHQIHASERRSLFAAKKNRTHQLNSVYKLGPIGSYIFSFARS